MKTRFFIPPPFGNEPPHPLLAHRFGDEHPWMGLFSAHLPPNYFQTDAEFVDSLDAADAVLLSHNFRSPDNAMLAYVAKWCRQAENTKKPLYVFAFGDLNDTVAFDQYATVFRLSAYRSTMRPQDVVVPTTVEVFPEETLSWRPKNEIPSVSFCGYAGFQTQKQWFIYGLKIAFRTIQSFFEPNARARIQGIYWRRVAMKTLRRASDIQTNFIVRHTFSGAGKTIELDPAQARAEFITSIQESDFVLTPKGDGNYSNRFLETLALGRIPVFIDTDAPLPMEDTIEYDRIMVRVPMSDVSRIGENVTAFWTRMSEDNWVATQHLARDTFERYLRQDVFFRNYFGKV